MTDYDPNFDGQKLIYHPARVAEWVERGTTSGPLYTEMTLTDRCNCRCMFCGVDYDVNQAGIAIEARAACSIIDELALLGNKAVMFCGNGEPLLHPRAAEIIAYGSSRMSASVTTNGITLDRAGLELLDGLEWIRFSVNGGTPETYALVHGTGPDVFGRVVANIAAAVERKMRKALRLTIGVQLVLLDENAHTATTLARLVRDLGVDYFSVKPYSAHPLSRNRLTVDRTCYAEIGDELGALETASFKVIFRTRSFAKLKERRPYEKCYGTHFILFVSANGDLWACNNYVGDRRFFIGNACRESLVEIWRGSQRGKVVAFIEDELDVGLCRNVCRMDECNRYLWRLKHPLPHDNFV